MPTWQSKRAGCEGIHTQRVCALAIAADALHCQVEIFSAVVSLISLYSHLQCKGVAALRRGESGVSSHENIAKPIQHFCPPARCHLRHPEETQTAVCPWLGARLTWFHPVWDSILWYRTKNYFVVYTSKDP
jgi:hypothetical protein